mmetsp:Transcript_30039/g.64118  ORF Transcript_30039/g.64118 Transcript_30039/m.64118 type:complete len:206 (+) Transcript_30039:1030-1647(+)
MHAARAQPVDAHASAVLRVGGEGLETLRRSEKLGLQLRLCPPKARILPRDRVLAAAEVALAEGHVKGFRVAQLVLELARNFRRGLRALHEHPRLQPIAFGLLDRDRHVRSVRLVLRSHVQHCEHGLEYAEIFQLREGAVHFLPHLLEVLRLLDLLQFPENDFGLCLLVAHDLELVHRARLHFRLVHRLDPVEAIVGHWPARLLRG